ncbi:hypothetical protein M426DRAFT_17113 [Hypoxylon sp. CI-4A]|nr:hypothetical protein M426DRAFT_17113 [Hypoxylon sp. CI-4A]
MPYSSRASIYFLSVGSVILGLHCFIRPREEYPRFGLPLEFAPRTPKALATSDSEDQGRVSPLMHLKGIREATYGLALGALQCQGNDAAVTTLMGVISLAGLGDGIIVWFHAGDEMKHKAFGHVGAFVFLGGWSLWRALA